MDVFTYTAWLRDTNLSAEDQNYEFPASFNVIASNKDSASRWGDKLAKRLSRRRPQIQYIRSEATTGPEASLPTIIYGHDASDKEIGW